MVRFSCPKCQLQLKASQAQIGRILNCPKCDTAVLVPKSPLNQVADDDDHDEPDESDALVWERSGWLNQTTVLTVMLVLAGGSLMAGMAYGIFTKRAATEKPEVAKAGADKPSPLLAPTHPANPRTAVPPGKSDAPTPSPSPTPKQRGPNPLPPEEEEPRPKAVRPNVPMNPGEVDPPPGGGFNQPFAPLVPQRPPGIPGLPPGVGGFPGGPGGFPAFPPGIPGAPGQIPGVPGLPGGPGFQPLQPAPAAPKKEVLPETKALIAKLKLDAKDKQASVRIKAYTAMGELGSNGADCRRALCEGMMDPDPSGKAAIAAADALKKIDPDMQKLAVDISLNTSLVAMEKAFQIGAGAECLIPIVTAVANRNLKLAIDSVTAAATLNLAMRTLVSIGSDDPQVNQGVIAVLSHPNSEVRGCAVGLVPVLKNRKLAKPQLLVIAMGPNEPLLNRVNAIRVLPRTVDENTTPEVRKKLESMRFDKVPEIRDAVDAALKELPK